MEPAGQRPALRRSPTFNSITSLTNVYGNPASFPNGDPFPYTYSPSHPRFLPAASVETISQNYAMAAGLPNQCRRCSVSCPARSA